MSSLKRPQKRKRAAIELTSSIVVVQVQNGRRCAKEYRLDEQIAQESRPEATKPRSEISIVDDITLVEFEGLEPARGETEVVVTPHRKTKVSMPCL
jgi:hypothetical protein